MSYDAALERLGQEGDKFDIIYMDPPYKMAETACRKVCELICEHGLLKEDGILLCEHASDLPFDASSMALDEVRSCSYGLTVITFFVEKNKGE